MKPSQSWFICVVFQPPSFSWFGQQRSSGYQTARRWVSELSEVTALLRLDQIQNTWNWWLCLWAGLDGAVGGRCFLEVPLLHHPAGHHVSVEAVRQQPKASVLNISSLWSKSCLSFKAASMCSVCRYAFTPLIDDSDDEEIEEFLVSANIGQ